MIVTAEDRQEMVEREGMTCCKGPRGGIEPLAAAARSQPLYMGCLLCQVSGSSTPRGSFPFEENGNGQCT